MPIRDSYPPGMPCWVDLGTTDPAAARTFYADLFGWTADVDPRPEAGGYGQFMKDGQTVAGVGPLMAEGQPTAWAHYIASTDVDASAAAVTEHGGTVLMPPFDVLDAGRMTMFSDPEGAVSGIWQANRHPGAGLVTEPGAWNMSTLATRDAERAATFYEPVFGWKVLRDPEWGDHWELAERIGTPDQDAIASLADLNEGFPPQVPAHWQVCFMVADAEGTIARATEAGATTHGPLIEMPMNLKMGGLADPQGAQFAIIGNGGGPG